MLELAVQHVGHRFESAVWMIGCALGLARAIVRRPHFVEQQKGIDEGQPCGWERPTDDEAAALELAVRGDHAFDLTTHVFLFLPPYHGSQAAS